MSNFNKLAVLQSLDSWKQYKEELAFELTRQKSALASGMQFPKEPKKYPCLVAALAPTSKADNVGTFDFPNVICCFVYPEDASRLLEVVSGNSPSFNPVIDGDVSVELKADAPESLSDSDDLPKSLELEYEYRPSQVGILVLSLIVEMRAIGALKPDKFVQTVNKVEQWLIKHMNTNKDRGPIDILNRLWEDNSIS